MHYSSVQSSGLFRLKGKSRKTFNIIASTKSLFFLHFDLGRGLQRGSLPPRHGRVPGTLHLTKIVKKRPCSDLRHYAVVRYYNSSCHISGCFVRVSKRAPPGYKPEVFNPRVKQSGCATQLVESGIK